MSASEQRGWTPPAEPLAVFFAPGVPQPKGSMRAYTYRKKNGKVGARATPGNEDKLKNWQLVVETAAREVWDTAPSDMPCVIHLRFFMPRPKSHYSSGGSVKGNAPAFCPRKPDLDKLVRAVFDAMEGVVYTNDSRVVAQTAIKFYEWDGGPGVEVGIWAA